MPDADRRRGNGTDEGFEGRLRAVERALVDGDADLSDLQDGTALGRRLDDLEERLDDLEARADDLDAALQAVRGYVGSVRHVNEEVAGRAETALAKVERLEGSLDGGTPDERGDDFAADLPGTTRTRRPDGSDATTGATGRRPGPRDHGDRRGPATTARPGSEDPTDGLDPDAFGTEGRADSGTNEGGEDGGLLARLGDWL